MFLDKGGASLDAMESIMIEEMKETLSCEMDWCTGEGMGSDRHLFSGSAQDPPQP